jgi:hypothetical protein
MVTRRELSSIEHVLQYAKHLTPSTARDLDEALQYAYDAHMQDLHRAEMALAQGTGGVSVANNGLVESHRSALRLSGAIRALRGAVQYEVPSVHVRYRIGEDSQSRESPKDAPRP